uniref:Uncharacterized protein n=1 Tax=Plectus sambesii TaxID=2011161 RepID=A0A914W2N9_9BILA
MQQGSASGGGWHVVAGAAARTSRSAPISSRQGKTARESPESERIGADGGRFSAQRGPGYSVPGRARTTKLIRPQRRAPSKFFRWPTANQFFAGALYRPKFQ